MILLTNQDGNIPCIAQNERYAFSDDFVLIFFAKQSFVSVISLFL